ncbi:Sterol 3-beta-glucosyltransferase [Ascosphaera acerosa]|nr:Sterol 3-beta-glucosyltransferase [Ascosphaera acerosa]
MFRSHIHMPTLSLSSANESHDNRHDGSEDDERDDVLAPPRSFRGVHDYHQPLHQSIFSLITAAGPGRSARHQPPHSDSGSGSESDNEGGSKQGTQRQAEPQVAQPATQQPLSLSAEDEPHEIQQHDPDDALDTAARRSDLLSRQISSFHTSQADDDDDDYDTTHDDNVAGSPADEPDDLHDISLEDEDRAAEVAKRLQGTFGLKEPETVILEQQAWFIRGVLLQGYMYITEQHICFYAHLPSQPRGAKKAGYLSRLRHDYLRYTRYWFTLQDDVLTYFRNPADTYFPSGHIDLRNAVSATQRNASSKSKDFCVTTQSRTHWFRADSPNSAKSWVDSIREVIFRTANEGNSVKVCIPIRNVVDMEETIMFRCAEAIRLRAIEDGETYALDEYMFGFLSHSQDVTATLRALVEEAGHPQAPALEPQGEQAGAPQRSLQRSVQEPIVTTIQPPRRSRGRSFTTKTADSPFLGLPIGMHHVRSRSESDACRGLLQPPHHADNMPVDQPHATVGVRAASRPRARSLLRSPPLRPVENRLHAFSHRRGSSTGHIIHPSTAASRIDPSASAQQEAEPTGTATSLKRLSSGVGALQGLVRYGTYPLQRAVEVADSLRTQGKRVGSLLVSKPSGYYEKVTGMWTGPSTHYDENEHVTVQQAAEAEDDEATAEDTEQNYGDRFRAHFGLPDSEKLLATHYAYLHRVLPLYGKIYLGTTKICYRSLLPSTKTQMVLPMEDVENVEQERGFQFGYHGLTIIIRGHEELFFQFRSERSRDDCAVMLLRSIESLRHVQSGARDMVRKSEDSAETGLRKTQQGGSLTASSAQPHGIINTLSFDDPRASIIDLTPTEPMRITCLTIGSRGDVQPYLALAKGLMAEGHVVKVATHAEFEPWIRKHGVDFAPIEGEPAELMRICVENGMFTYSFLKEASAKFRGWIDGLLTSSWAACQDCDLLIESPSAMGGIHIAEALGIPYFRAFTMPWTKTRVYPHAFAVPDHKMGGAYNYMTYVMFDTLFWKAIAWQVNAWRKKELGLPSTNLDKMQQGRVPFLYNFSPSVVPPPLDFSDWVRVTGYWFLDEETDWKPPDDLLRFLEQARTDDKKIVYIGFGSIVVADPFALTKTIADAVLKAGVRCILSKGWSGRLEQGGPSAAELEFKMPPEIYEIGSVPHAWLFARTDAVVHHGGAGTTGASLRAGKPTIIKPFFGDQYFFGTRVEDLGVGIQMKKLNVALLSRSLWEATRNDRMIEKARSLGEKIRSENGVETAIEALYRDLEYAKTLSRQKAQGKLGDTTADGNESPLEDWTIVSHVAGSDPVIFTPPIDA